MSTSEPINRAVAGIDAPTRPAQAPAAAAGARNVKIRKKKRRITGLDILAIIFMAFMLAFSLVPLAWMFSTSVKSQFAAIRQPPVWIPDEPTLVAYQTLLSPNSPIGGRFLNYMLNSLKVSLATTVLGLLIAIPAAYAFSRFRFPGRNALFFAVLVRNMFPTIVFLIPLFVLMTKLRLVDNQLSLVLTYLTFGLPLSIWLLKGFYDNIPEELERAARIDGATRFGAFWRIVLPLSSPGIIATGIFAFIGAWNEYAYASVFLNTERLKTLQPGLQKFFGEFSTNWPGLMAAQFISSIPVVVIFLVLQRYFVKALAEGATKA